MHPRVSKTDLRSKLQKSAEVFLFPEASVLHALNEWFIARQLTGYMQFIQRKRNEWTMQRSFAILMGAVVVSSNQPLQNQESSIKNKWVLKSLRTLHILPSDSDIKRHGLEISDRSLATVLSQGSNAAIHESNDYILQLLNKQWEEIPDDKDLDKRSKTDGFLKIVALFQALEFFVRNIVWRKWSKVEVSLLEVATLGYLFCALITFLVFYPKPQGIEDPFTINLRSWETQDLRA
ncbi:hypothetical protein PG984_003854 [Apiospora sp. TS-2023a]